jgi:hypothetical protein
MNIDCAVSSLRELRTRCAICFQKNRMLGRRRRFTHSLHPARCRFCTSTVCTRIHRSPLNRLPVTPIRRSKVMHNKLTNQTSCTCLLCKVVLSACINLRSPRPATTMATEQARTEPMLRETPVKVEQGDGEPVRLESGAERTRTFIALF